MASFTKMCAELRASTATGTKEAVSCLLNKLEEQFEGFKQAHVECLAETDEEQHPAMIELYNSLAGELNGVKSETSDWLKDQEEKEEEKRNAFEEERAELQKMLEEIRRERQLLRNEQSKQHASATSTVSPPASDAASTDGDDSASTNGASTAESILQKLTELSFKRDDHLKAPEMTKFNGDPCEYSKFIHSFEASVHCKVTSNRARLNYLVHYCEGEPKRAIDICTMMPEDTGYTRAREILSKRYGSPHLIARSCFEKIVKGNAVKANDPKALSDFALELQRTQIVLQELKYTSNLNSWENINRLVMRLPFYLRTKWQEHAYKITKNEAREANFSDFSEFVEDESMCANSAYGVENAQARSSSHAPRKGDRVKVTTMSVNQKKSYVQRNCRVCEKSCISAANCDVFRKMSVADRETSALKCRLCRNCLKPGHFARACYKASLCTQPGCTEKHSELLHKGEAAVTSLSTCASYSASTKTCLGVIPVRLTGPKGQVYTYALLDNGSDKTLLEQNQARQLGLRGQTIDFTLNALGTGAEGEKFYGQEFDLKIQALEGEGVINARRVWTVKSLPISADLAAKQRDVDCFPHLKGITLPSLIGGRVTLIVGMDNPDAHRASEQRVGKAGEPLAERTPLGWVVRGPVGVSSPRSANVNLCTVQDMNITDTLKKMYEEDFVEKQPLRNHTVEAEMCNASFSVEDKFALNQMKSSIRVTENGHYEMGLLWKENAEKLPENKFMAENRLKGLKKKLEANAKLKEMYTETLEGYISEGHAKEVIDKQSSAEQSWYIPHHGVFHPHKPDKVRVVFDCAARSGRAQLSLNDCLLQGPDFITSLIGVLLRFRQERVAIQADIKAMFHQVFVSEQHRSALKFLWWKGGDLTRPPSEYAMQVFLFGAKCSPSCACYALKRAAVDQSDEYTQTAVKTVLKNFYVDDMLKSVATECEAVALRKELKEMLKNRGFELTKWVSNSENFLTSVPEEDREKSVKSFQLGESLPEGSTLGLKWNIERDCFCFRVNVASAKTRREILSVVASLYDPLGFVAPVTLCAKKVLQEMCEEGAGWDGTVSPSILERWERWVTDLPQIEKLEIPRCIKSSKLESAELHVFVDASEMGYGACAYVVIVGTQGETTSSLVMGKSRVSPSKKQTLPRLELTAATVGARMGEMIENELEIKLKKRVFWTDSAIVLGYLNNKKKRFKTFVANRVAVINECSSPNEWRHVPGKLNPADLASRGFDSDDVKSFDLWLKGPEFLVTGEYPQSSVLPVVSESDPEVKREATSFAIVPPVASFLHYYSNFEKLKRAVAWLLRYKVYFIKCSRKETFDMVKFLSLRELRNAENEILKFVQRDEFSREIDLVCSGKQVQKGSKLAALCPVMRDGVLCVGGRLQSAAVCTQAKHPAILPSKHHVTRLVINSTHKQQGHMGVNQTLACTRERFWILCGRQAVKTELKSCVRCRRVQGRTLTQQMAPLRSEQLAPQKPPFTFVAIDFFGPLRVKVKRSHEKRYGLILTCLTLRAVHIEVTHSLSTDSFLNALMRFMGRRGKPEKIFSDQGGSFVAGEREIRESIDMFNEEKINKHLAQKNIEFHQNTPHSSHKNGAAERMIKSVRKILNSVVNLQLLTDEQLVTVMCECEKILNDRPLTYVSDDVNSLDVLTPSKLLLLRSNSCLPAGIFKKDENFAVRAWRQSQHIANMFWSRFMKEYMLTLQERSKWQRTTRNVKEGDIVLVHVPNVPRGRWPIARVVGVIQGRDGLVRSIKVRTATTELARPPTELVMLEMSD